MSIARSIRYSLLASFLAVAGFAQDTASVRGVPSQLALRFSYSIAFTQSRPQGELARNIGLGYGANASAFYRLDDAGVFSLRADVGGLQYGNASRNITLSEDAGSNIRLKLNTSNYIMPVSVGPQVSWPMGIVRPYVNAGVGLQGYFTETRLEGENAGANIASTTNQSDFVASLSVGGGIYLKIPAKGRNVLVDVAAQYLDGSRAKYLAPASVNASTGTLSLTPIESNAHLLVLKVGARMGL